MAGVLSKGGAWRHTPSCWKTTRTGSEAEVLFLASEAGALGLPRGAKDSPRPSSRHGISTTFQQPRHSESFLSVTTFAARAECALCISMNHHSDE